MTAGYGGRLQPWRATAAEDNGGATTTAHNDGDSNGTMETVAMKDGEGVRTGYREKDIA